MIPFNDLTAAVAEIRDEIDEAVARVLSSGWFVLGNEVEAFEREFAQYCGVDHCVGVASGFDALALTLRAWDIGPGDEVLVPSMTAVATWMAVTAAGATPVGVDVDARTRCMDPALVRDAITERTRAIVPVHLYGQPADLTALVPIARRHGLRLLEDCAQAHGAQVGTQRVGSIGDAGAFSFYPTKNLGGLGDGGAVITRDGGLAARLRMLRSYGWDTRDDPVTKGGNSRLDEIQAAVLRVKLARLDAWTARRRDAARLYHDGLAHTTGLTLPWHVAGTDPVWHLFVVQHPQRDALRRTLTDAGITTQVHYRPPPFLARTYQDDGWRAGAFPVAEQLAKTVFSLPMYAQIPPASVEDVARTLVRATSADPTVSR